MRTAPTGLQKGKYRCARVTTLAGLHVSVRTWLTFPRFPFLDPGPFGPPHWIEHINTFWQEKDLKRLPPNRRLVLSVCGH